MQQFVSFASGLDLCAGRAGRRRSASLCAAFCLSLLGGALGGCDGTSDCEADDSCDGGPITEPDAPATYSPPWTFEPWISKDISDGPDTYAFVDGFQERDIPVGAVVIDSPWGTNYTTFIVNEERYPDFPKMVEDLHAEDIRIVMWTTQMINESSFDVETGGDVYDGPSPNLREASRNDYLVNDAETYFWWKGYGAGIDFFNEEAMDWWHAQQDNLLDVGIDGWKLDFGEEYIITDTVKTAKGEVPHQEYSEAYYKDFLEYGVKKRGRDFTTMVRPYDESYGFPGRFFARPEHAPVGWPGDQTRDWIGYFDGMDHVFRSAQAGYVNLGTDIGGYLDNYNGNVIPFDVDIFLQWTSSSGFLPFFQLHGRDNLAPWTIEERTDEVVTLYRYYASLHHHMVPFWFSLAEAAYRGGPIPVQPIGDTPDAWANDWRWVIDETFLVAPIFEGATSRDVELPSGGRWMPFLLAERSFLDGGTTAADVTPQSGDPAVFLKEGAIVPMVVDNDATGFGDASSADALTILVAAAFDDETTERVFPLAIEGTDRSRFVDLTLTAAADGERTFTVAHSERPVIVVLRSDVAVATSKVGDAVLDEHGTWSDFSASTTGFYVDAERGQTFFKAQPSDGPIVFTFSTGS